MSIHFDNRDRAVSPRLAQVAVVSGHLVLPAELVRQISCVGTSERRNVPCMKVKEL